MTAATTTAAPDLTAQIRALLDDADTNGQPRPGRGRLVKLTGASEHHVRAALAALADHGRQDRQRATRTDALVMAFPDQGEPTVEMPAITDHQGNQPTGDAAELTASGSADSPPAATATASAATGDAPLTTRPAGRMAKWPSRFPLAVIGLAAAVAIWSGWVGLGKLTGFGDVQLLPGLVDSLHINTAVVLPLGVEFYGLYALRTWLSAAPLSARTRTYARWSSFASLAVGAAAQVAYHLMAAAHMVSAPWQITTLVACVPVCLVALAAGLARLVADDHQRQP